MNLTDLTSVVPNYGVLPVWMTRKLTAYACHTNLWMLATISWQLFAHFQNLPWSSVGSAAIAHILLRHKGMLILIWKHSHACVSYTMMKSVLLRRTSSFNNRSKLKGHCSDVKNGCSPSAGPSRKSAPMKCSKISTLSASVGVQIRLVYCIARTNEENPQSHSITQVQVLNQLRNQPFLSNFHWFLFKQ